MLRSRGPSSKRFLRNACREALCPRILTRVLVYQYPSLDRPLTRCGAASSHVQQLAPAPSSSLCALGGRPHGRHRPLCSPRRAAPRRTAPHSVAQRLRRVALLPASIRRWRPIEHACALAAQALPPRGAARDPPRQCVGRLREANVRIHGAGQQASSRTREMSSDASC